MFFLTPTSVNDDPKVEILRNYLPSVDKEQIHVVPFLEFHQEA